MNDHYFSKYIFCYNYKLLFSINQDKLEYYFTPRISKIRYLPLDNIPSRSAMQIN